MRRTGDNVSARVWISTWQFVTICETTTGGWRNNLPIHHNALIPFPLHQSSRKRCKWLISVPHPRRNNAIITQVALRSRAAVGGWQCRYASQYIESPLHDVYGFVSHTSTLVHVLVPGADSYCTARRKYDRSARTRLHARWTAHVYTVHLFTQRRRHLWRNQLRSWNRSWLTAHTQPYQPSASAVSTYAHTGWSNNIKHYSFIYSLLRHKAQHMHIKHTIKRQSTTYNSNYGNLYNRIKVIKFGYKGSQINIKFATALM